MFRSTICASIFVALLFSTLHADDKAEVKRKRLSAQTEKKPAKSQNEPSSKKDKPKASSKPAVKKPNPEKSAPKKSDSKKKLDPAALKKAALAKKQAAEKKAGTTKDSPKKDATKQPVLTIGTDTEYYKSSPAQASAPDGKLKAGTKVYLIKKAGSYTYVKTVDGIAGYVSTDSLKRSDPIKAKKPVPKQTTAASSAKSPPAGDFVKVFVQGKLTTGIAAIGGETTGTTISSNGITWELDFNGNNELAKLADSLNGKEVYVAGMLNRKQGVEIKERWIVTVKLLKGSPAKKK